MVRALASTDTWAVAKEVFIRKPDSNGVESCTLSLHAHFGDGVESNKIAKIISAFANALYNKTDIIISFLHEWLDETKKFEGYDWAFKTPAERIGIALLALARTGLLTTEYYPLIRPYHEYTEHSTLPLSILAELLTYTSPEHQQLICGKLDFYIIYEFN